MQYIRVLLFYSVIFQSCKFQSPPPRVASRFISFIQNRCAVLAVDLLLSFNSVDLRYMSEAGSNGINADVYRQVVGHDVTMVFRTASVRISQRVSYIVLLPQPAVIPSLHR